MKKVLIWDWLVCFGYWLMVGGFIVVWLIGDSEIFCLVYVIVGVIVFGVVIFCLFWGFIGSCYVCFVDFVCGLIVVKDYLVSLFKLELVYYVGYNLVGGWVIVLLFGFGILIGLVGWVIYNDIGGYFVEELYEGLVMVMLMVVFVYVVGVFFGSLLYGENLVCVMLIGYKQGSVDEVIFLV